MKLVFRWILVVLWAAFIFYMSSKSGLALEYGDDLIGRIHAQLAAWQTMIFGSGVDVISPTAHFVEYFIFGLLMSWALAPKFTRAQCVVLTLLIAGAFAASDEWHQSFVPGRTMDIVDFIVDACALSLGALIAPNVTSRRRRQSA